MENTLYPIFAFISYEMQMQVSTVVIVSLRVCIY